jgi:hypothetical protein
LDVSLDIGTEGFSPLEEKFVIFTVPSGKGETSHHIECPTHCLDRRTQSRNANIGALFQLAIPPFTKLACVFDILYQIYTL